MRVTSTRAERWSAAEPSAQLSSWERAGPAESAPGDTLRFDAATQSGAFPVQRISVRMAGPFGGARTLNLGAGDDTPRAAKIVGAVSLVSWLGVLYWGRMLPYVGSAF